ncbi:MAG: PKD domain-containing protein, partial [Euryarchaeota archaeon]|nr:PKD domain-containing protein [Euryarchaeota archaeon]
MRTPETSREPKTRDDYYAPGIASVDRRERKRVSPLLRTLAFFAILILVTSYFSGAARAGNSPPGNANDNGLQVTNLQGAVCLNPTCSSLSNNPGHATVGQKLLFTGTIQGGLVYNSQICQQSGTIDPLNGQPNPCIHGIPGDQLFVPGYHIFWFFGEVNNTPNPSQAAALQQNLPVPSSCTAPGNIAGPPNGNGYTPPQCTALTAFSQPYTYNRTGTFEVSTTVYDANFDWVITTTLVTVVAPQFTVNVNSALDTSTPNGTSATQLEEGLPVAFTGSCGPTVAACNDTQLAWNFGDGGVGYGISPTHIYELRGNYVVSLTGTNIQTGAMNRSFYTLNVSNIGAFLSVGQSVRSGINPGLNGPSPVVYNAPAPGPSVVRVNSAPIIVKAGVSLSFCTWSFDFSSIDAQNLTFQWHFSNSSEPYTSGGALALAPHDAAQRCEPQSYHYFYGEQAVLSPEFTTISHTFTCPGWYNVTVDVIDPQGIRARAPPSQMFGTVWYRDTIEVQVVNLTAPPQSLIPTYQVPVGQVALMNASNTLGIPPTSAFYNYTWNAGNLGTTWGDVGRDTSFRAVNKKVALTAQVNSTAIPCCNPHPI